MSESTQAGDRKYGVDTVRDVHTGRFGKGNTGRPAGARNRATTAAMTLLEGEAERLTRKAVDLALEGDVAALRLCLERILPKGRMVRLSLPLGTVEALDAAMIEIGDALADGRLALDEAKAAAEIVEARRRVIEMNDLAAQLRRIEETMKEIRGEAGADLRCEDASGDAVPVPSASGQEAVPDARRKVRRA